MLMMNLAVLFFHLHIPYTGIAYKSNGWHHMKECHRFSFGPYILVTGDE